MSRNGSGSWLWRHCSLVPDPSSLCDLIANRHVGSVLIIGNWTSGIAGVAAATSTLQSYAPGDNQLLMSTDQEGGLSSISRGRVRYHAFGHPAGRAMDVSQLRAPASAWGTQLKAAGINVDLAPVVGTVTVDRSSNAPIGALYRDFGLDPAGNADHAKAFIQGMSDSG